MTAGSTATAELNDRDLGGLPPQPGGLIGRDDELKTTRAQLLTPGVRLLTLIGPGGVGKTRLAVAVAEALRDGHAFPDGVRFVDLTPVPEPAVVPAVVARALRVSEAEGRTALEALRDFLAQRRLLLVLDNVEHVLGAAADLGYLLGACPGLVVLATSREPLRVRWERTLPVGPLAAPDPHHPPPLAELAAVPAVALFVERARAALPAFALTPENAPAVAALCHRLDGLPLAIELAAARAALLGPELLLERLGRRLPLPASVMQDAPARHRTLGATIQWSYDLLDGAEQALFRRVAAFAGGWTLEAAEAVAGLGGDPPQVPDVLSGLTSLADKSLVQVRTPKAGAAGGLRFRMLETARGVALDLLEASGEAEPSRRRHAAYFVALAEQAEPRLRGPAHATAASQLEREEGNFRQALRWALERGDAEALELGLRIAGALGWYWFLHGYPAEAREWLMVLLRPAAAAPPRGDTTDGFGGPGAITGLPAAVRARALNAAGLRAIEYGEYDLAATLHEQALVAWRELGDTRGTVAALHGLADASLWRGDAETARARYEEGLALAHATGSADDEALFAFHLGQLWWVQGDQRRAQDYGEQALATARATGSSTWTAYALFVLASAAHERRDLAKAGALYREAVALAGATGDRLCLRMVLPGLAGAEAMGGDPVRALTLAGAAAALHEQAGVAPFPPIRARQERWLASAREALDPRTADAALAAGRAMTTEQAVAFALEAGAPVAAPAGAPGRTQAPVAGPLSPREREVLALVAEGKSNREIAAILVVTENTAKYHVTQLLNKLGAGSRAEAVARAVAAGLLTLGAD